MISRRWFGGRGLTTKRQEGTFRMREILYLDYSASYTSAYVLQNSKKGKFYFVYIKLNIQGYKKSNSQGQD